MFFLFWAGALLLVYIYVGYPLLVAVLSRILLRLVRFLSTTTPMLSVVVVAHNEERRIAARLNNLISLDYPSDRLEILVASDGSSDRTAELAKAYESERLRVFACLTRRGKPAVLNDVVPYARGEVVVFADARQRVGGPAPRLLAAA